MGSRQLAVTIYDNLSKQEKENTSVDALIRQIHIFKSAGCTDGYLKKELPRTIPEAGEVVGVQLKSRIETNGKKNKS